MSAFSGPYKSRLFSFINRQFLHVSTQLEKTVRHVRVSAQWGIQTLLYPLYWLVQSGRTVANRLNQTTTKALESAQAPDADRPVEQVLEAAQPLLTTTAAQVSRRYPKKRHICANRIQGVATLLETRELVLVVSGNHIINILSQEQQHKLRQRIIWEVANYWYARRLSTKAERLPSFRKGSAKVLAPVRFFLGVMRWVQSSPVAIALNLFGESTLVCPRRQSALDRSQLKSQISSQPTEFEQSAATVTPPAHSTSRIRSLIRAAIDYFFGDRRPRWMLNPQKRLSGTTPATPSLAGSKVLISEPSSLPTTHRWWNVILPSNKLTQAIKRVKRSPLLQSKFLINSEDPFDMRVLIRSAVDYFFGRQPTALSGASYQQQLSGHSPSFSPTLPPPNTAGWLAWEDLFETEVNENPTQLVPSQKPSVPARLDLNKLKGYLKGHKQVTALSATETEVEPSHSKDTTQTELVPAQHDTLKSSPDWIETSATKIGYIKHPLERMLEWLDRIILWLEELVVGIWHRVRQQG